MNLRIAELDFDQIKTNLKTFLKSQSEFSDYDFEGSGLSVLIDLLAYNTHYNAYLANMLVNEMFLDSAVKRSSAVSIAKHLGYTPRSVTGSTAIVDLTVNGPTGNPSTLTLERYTPFTTSIDGQSYTFLNTTPYTIQPTDGLYKINNVAIKEGSLLEYQFVVAAPGPSEKYEIPNPSIDTQTMFVTVQKSATDTTTDTFVLATDLTNITRTSKIYFLEETPSGYYQIYFGDGILGQKLTSGNIVRVQYLASSGSVSNVSGIIAQSFTPGTPIGGSSDVIVSVVSNATGGTDKESLTSIKFNAPRSNLAKNRAVTKTDYSAIIKQFYSQVESVSVWGGEENIPPVYGKVFISLKPYQGYVIDAPTRENIKNSILRDRQVLTVTPEFVDPDYIHLNLTVTIDYRTNQTNLSASEISVIARTEIVNYFANEVQQFEKPFYYSQLLEVLNNINTAVASVNIKLRIQKRFNPALNVINSFLGDNILKFNNKLHPFEFESTKFFIVRNGVTVPVRMKDYQPGVINYGGTGLIRLYNTDDDTIVGTVGTINYSNGQVEITGITPVGFPVGQFDIRFTCAVQEDSYNIQVARNQIIVYDDSAYSAVSNRLPGITINVNGI